MNSEPSGTPIASKFLCGRTIADPLGNGRPTRVFAIAKAVLAQNHERKLLRGAQPRIALFLR